MVAKQMAESRVGLAIAIISVILLSRDECLSGCTLDQVGRALLGAFANRGFVQ